MKPEEILHAKIRKFLDRLGIEYVRSRTDKRTTQKRGVPDFLFAITTPITQLDCPVAWECKVEDRQLSDDQEKWRMKAQTKPNGWHYWIIRSEKEAKDCLRQYGIIS